MQNILNSLKRKGEGIKARPQHKKAGHLLAFFSLCFLCVIALEYLYGANATAIISSYPIWFLAFIFALPAGLSWLVFGSRFGLAMLCVWILFIVLMDDHLPALSRLGKQHNYLTATSRNHSQIHRLVSLNCAGLTQLDPVYVRNYKPTVVFLKNLELSHDIEEFALQLFNENAQIRKFNNCAIITSGGQFDQTTPVRDIPNLNGFILDWHPPNENTKIRLVCVALEQADHFKHSFTPSNWQYYSTKRYIHRQQVANLLAKLRCIAKQDGEFPVLIGGQFTEQASSPIFKPIKKYFTDPYHQYGKGYGATFPAELPIFRTTRIFGSSLVNFHHSGVIYVPNAKEKAVYADFCTD